ncbi:MAG: translation initiation factor IF-2 [Lachnospiraceae bacterium]|nr:translation initiation factor IF-2 [Lachnospiraceae bacterium]
MKKSSGGNARRSPEGKDAPGGRKQGKPVSQVFDGRSERDKRAIASASTPAVSRGSRKALTETLGDKIKGFEIDPSAETIDYSQVPKKKKKEIELPPNPLKAEKKTEEPDREKTEAAMPATPVDENQERTQSSRPVPPQRKDAHPERDGVREQRAPREGVRDGERPARGPRPERNNTGRDAGRPQGGRPYGGESRPQGGRPYGGEGRPQGGRPYGGEGRPQGGRPYGGEGRPQGGRPYGGEGRPQGGRPYGGEGRPQGGRPYGGEGRPQGGRSYGGEGRGQGGRTFGGQGGFAGKDEEPVRRTYSKKNDSRSSSMRELTNEIGGRSSARADNLKDRSRDKNRKDRNTAFDEDGMRNGKQKKDPNRKGAFQKPVAKPREEVVDDIKTITVPEVITIKELADKMKQSAAAIIKKLFMGGKMVNLNSEISYEEAEEIAMDYEILCEKEVKVNLVEELLKDTEEEPDKLVKRPPVVCVMGHVDHGKTSLLDAIRKTNVTAREAGGITQHIGAYMVEVNERKITFLDTPGHEAFTSMRMRGAKSTDIAILVVAADDGVMPQTVEAINHAKAAGVQIIVAVNKIDKPGANVERVKQELTEHGLVAEDWGGDVVFAPVSAKTGEGIQNLLEMVLLTADVLELKANPDRKARGIVIEAQLDKGRGPVATVLIQKGTLKVGENVAIGAAHGKVRAMIDDNGHKVRIATPSTPVEILGLNAVPEAGEVMLAVADEKEARNIASAFISQNKEKLIAETKARMSLDGLFSQIQAGEVKELNLIVKADVMGSVEAVKQSLEKLSNEEVVVRIIHGGVGNINESDVTLASASNAIIIGFNVKPDNTAKEISEREKVDIKLYKVIYNAIDDIEAAMKGMLKPIYEERVIAHAEIRQLFKASGLGVIAGSFVLDGKVEKGCSARITRGGEQIFDGALASLKRFKDDVKEVAAGYECGFVFEKFNDIAELDQVEFYKMVEVPRT